MVDPYNDKKENQQFDGKDTLENKLDSSLTILEGLQ